MILPGPLSKPIAGQKGSVAGDGFDRIKVSAIFSRDNHYLAIINGQTLQVGQSLGQFKVVAINADGVTLANDEQRRTFAIYHLKIKQDITHGFK